SSCSPRLWFIPQAFIGSLPNPDGTGTSKYLAVQEVNGRRTLEGDARNSSLRLRVGYRHHARMIRLVERKWPGAVCREKRPRTVTVRDVGCWLWRISALLLSGWPEAQAAVKPLRLAYFPNITHAQALYARATG